MISIVVPIKGHTIIKKLLQYLEVIELPYEYEIVVIDAAPESTKDLKVIFPKVRWIAFPSETTESVAEQRNYGINKSRGEIIVFIDADCIPTKKWLRNLVEPLINQNENITCGWIKSLRKYPLIWRSTHFYGKKNRHVSFAPTMNSAFKKEVFKKIGTYDPKFKYGAEDMDISLRAMLAGYKILYCPSAVIYHDWGDIKRNIYRMYSYGKANFTYFEKHAKNIKNNINVLYGTFAYPIFILSLPIIFVFPYYPLVLALPIIKTFLESKSILFTIESVLFNFLYGIGFLYQSLLWLKEKFSLNLSLAFKIK